MDRWNVKMSQPTEWGKVWETFEKASFLVFQRLKGQEGRNTFRCARLLRRLFYNKNTASISGCASSQNHLIGLTLTHLSLIPFAVNPLLASVFLIFGIAVGLLREGNQYWNLSHQCHSLFSSLEGGNLIP